MAEKKKEKEAWEKELELYEKDTTAAKKYTDTSIIKHHQIIADVLNDTSNGLLDEKGLIDYERLKGDKESLYDSLAKQIMEKSKKAFIPIIESNYGIKFDDKGEHDIFRRDFYNKFFGYHHNSVKEMFQDNQDNFTIDTYKNELMDNHVGKMRNDLSTLAASAISNKNISTIIKKKGWEEYFSKDGIDKMNNTLGKSLLVNILEADKKGLPIDYNAVLQISSNLSKQNKQDYSFFIADPKEYKKTG